MLAPNTWLGPRNSHRSSERREGGGEPEPVAPLLLVRDAEATTDHADDEGEAPRDPAEVPAEDAEERIDVEKEHRDLQSLWLRRVEPAAGLHA